jgi:hypothetical protein
MGPSFKSSTGEDLYAFEPFNREENCGSKTGGHGYNIYAENGKNSLTNKKDGRFTITELEVWEINYIK